MKKNYIFSFGLVGMVLSLSAHAQTDFRPGYVVRPAGDTVRGQVDYRSARRSALVCQFRLAPDAATQVFRPAELRSYGIQGEVGYRARLTSLPDSAARPRPARLIFLEILVDGPSAALYQWRVGSEETRYYVQKDQAALLKELTVSHQEVVDGTRHYYQDIPVFRGVLNEQFADCPSLLLSLAKTEFKASSLSSAVQRYNACRQPSAAVAMASKAASRLGVELLLGAQGSHLTFTNDSQPVSGSYKAGLTPELGIGVSIGSRAVRHKLLLRLEAHYARQRYEDEYTVAVTSASGATLFSPYTYQTHFRADYLRIPLLLRYSPLTSRVRPFVEAGVTISPLLQLEQESRYHTSISSTYGAWAPVYDTGSLRHVEYGFLAGAGLQLAGLASHPVSVGGRVETSNGFLATTGNYANVFRYHLLLAISLTKQP